MNMIRYLLPKKMGLFAIFVLTLLWGFGISTESKAQDSHAGHNHSTHTEDTGEDEHIELDHDEDADDDHGADELGDLHEEEEGHSGHEDDVHDRAEEGLSLTPEQRKRFGIVVQSAGSGSLQNNVTLPGEIVFNEDRVVHLVPRVSGIAREVYRSVGDHVKTNEILAVIDSRELADAKSEYMAAKARSMLAEKTFTREKALRKEQVSAEQDFLSAEQTLAEARIELRSAEQKLHALGFSEDAVDKLGSEQNEAITRYEIRSPIDGAITMKHISQGESLEADSEIFTVVDTTSVWVNLAVYTKNLNIIRKGQEVTLRVDHSGAQARGKIAMLTPFVEEATRSATARVVLDNRDGRWIPGTFVTGFIKASEENVPIVVPRDAVQNIEGRNVIFVENEGVFEMNSVTLGKADRANIEVTGGLEPGTRYVAQGAFQLKATIITSDLGSHAGHGH